MEQSKAISKLSSDLIRQKTTHDDPNALKNVITFCADFFKGSGLKTKIITHNGFQSLLISDHRSKIDILFHGHLDVVAAHQEQFVPILKGDKLFGRGSMDMKGAIAVFMILAKKHFAHTNHGLLLTTDEEIGGKNGCGHIVEKSLVKCKFFITGESTNLHIADEEKGVIWCTAKLKGTPTHASTPWDGKNAISKLKIFLNTLEEKFPQPKKDVWITTISPTIIQSTNSQNQIPGEISVKLDIRFIPTDDPQKIIRSLKKMCDELVIQNVEPPLGSIPHRYTEILKSLTSHKTRKMHFASDARFFFQVGVPSIILGPTGHDIHGNNEWVSIKSLIKFFEVLETFIKKV